MGFVEKAKGVKLYRKVCRPIEKGVGLSTFYKDQKLAKIEA